MAILRQANYRDKETKALQSALTKELDDIDGQIKSLSETLERATGEISVFSFPEKTTNQDHIQALKLFDQNLSNLTGFPPLTDINFSDYSFEAIDPIRAVFDKKADIGQSKTVEVDLRDFYKNLATQYSVVFASLQEMTKKINQLMDVIQMQDLDFLEDLLISLSQDLKLTGYLHLLFRLNLNALPNRNQYDLGGQRYLNTLDRSRFPEGFHFDAFEAFDLRKYLKSNLPIFDKAAAELYLRSVFDNSNIESIDLSEFNQ